MTRLSIDDDQVFPIRWGIENAPYRDGVERQDALNRLVRLVRAANLWRAEADVFRAEVAQARELLQAVRDLHFTRGRNLLGQPVCNECFPLKPMPCPTLRAITVVLNERSDGDR